MWIIQTQSILTHVTFDPDPCHPWERSGAFHDPKLNGHCKYQSMLLQCNVMCFCNQKDCLQSWSLSKRRSRSLWKSQSRSQDLKNLGSRSIDPKKACFVKLLSPCLYFPRQVFAAHSSCDRNFLRTTRHRTTMFWRPHVQSWCKIFMYFRVELLCKIYCLVPAGLGLQQTTQGSRPRQDTGPGILPKKN